MKLLNFYKRFGFPILLVIFFYALFNFKWVIVRAVLFLLFGNVAVSILHKLKKMEKEITSSDDKKGENDLETR